MLQVKLGQLDRSPNARLGIFCFIDLIALTFGNRPHRRRRGKMLRRLPVLPQSRTGTDRAPTRINFKPSRTKRLVALKLILSSCHGGQDSNLRLALNTLPKFDLVLQWGQSQIYLLNLQLIDFCVSARQELFVRGQRVFVFS